MTGAPPERMPGAGAAAGPLLILAGSWLATGGRMPPRRSVPAATRERITASGGAIDG